jgi:hypothetical protein
MARKHNIRCSECKNIAEEMYRKIYPGHRINREHKIPISVKIEDYEEKPYYKDLLKIYNKLQDFRGYHDFVKSKKLRACDLFIVNEDLVVELDETQHFSAARAVALSSYPDFLTLGFDRKKWIRLCKEINAYDIDPEYRDEQRAWYDTLRDFLPLIVGVKPTQRIYLGDYEWCSLDPDVKQDVSTFNKLISVPKQDSYSRMYWLDSDAKACGAADSTGNTISVFQGQDPVVARIITSNFMCGHPDDAVLILQAILDIWPENTKTMHLLAPGGFLHFPWPEDIDVHQDIWSPSSQTWLKFQNKSQEYLEKIVNHKYFSALKKHTRFFSFGMDSFITSEMDNLDEYNHEDVYTDDYHAELVVFMDLKTMKISWTGKFYSTLSQEAKLFHNPDLSSHFIRIDNNRIMILGCHDLSVFNPRARVSAKGKRKKRNTDFRRMAKQFKPHIVLQHPHTTDSDRIWLLSWAELNKELPNVNNYASTFSYYNFDEPPRAPLSRVLDKTRKGNTLDFIIAV